MKQQSKLILSEQNRPVRRHLIMDAAIPGCVCEQVPNGRSVAPWLSPTQLSGSSRGGRLRAPPPQMATVMPPEPFYRLAGCKSRVPEKKINRETPRLTSSLIWVFLMTSLQGVSIVHGIFSSLSRTLCWILDEDLAPWTKEKRVPSTGLTGTFKHSVQQCPIFLFSG